MQVPVIIHVHIYNTDAMNNETSIPMGYIRMYMYIYYIRIILAKGV